MKQLSIIEGGDKKQLIVRGSRIFNMVVDNEVSHDPCYVELCIRRWYDRYMTFTCSRVSFNLEGFDGVMCAVRFIRGVVMQLHSMHC